jgi:spermidine/putrescine transport system substrate-binding protein
MPKEGGTIWQDNLAIVADSPNQYTAHVFLNYLMRPDVAAKNTIFNLGITPNKDAEALLPENIKQLFTEGFAPDADVLKRTEWIVRNDKTSVFTDLWTAVKGQ